MFFPPHILIGSVLCVLGLAALFGLPVGRLIVAFFLIYWGLNLLLNSPQKSFFNQQLRFSSVTKKALAGVGGSSVKTFFYRIGWSNQKIDYSDKQIMGPVVIKLHVLMGSVKLLVPLHVPVFIDLNAFATDINIASTVRRAADFEMEEYIKYGRPCIIVGGSAVFSEVRIKAI